MTTPRIPITDRRFQYRSSSATDVQATWRAHGWRPASEQAKNVQPIKRKA